MAIGRQGPRKASQRKESLRGGGGGGGGGGGFASVPSRS